MAHGSSIVENSFRLYYLGISVYIQAPPTVVKNVAFVRTTLILYSRPNWYALTKSCINVNQYPVSATSLEICVVYEVYEILR